VYPEYFGLVAIEAMAAGSFAIGSANGGLGELLIDCGGATVPPGDDEALAAALSSHLADRAALWRTAGQQRRHVSSRYCQASMAGQYLDTYRTVTETAPGRRERKLMKLDDIKRLSTRALSLYRVARGPAEMLSVSRFAGSYLAHRLIHGKLHDAEASVRLRGTTFTLGLGGAETVPFSEIYVDRVYDQIAEFIPKRDWTVLDLGANAGVFSALQARRGARVYAFEPNPASFRHLLETVRANGYSNVTPFNCAVGREHGAARLVDDNCSVTGTVSMAGEEGEGVAVEVVGLDEIVPGLGIDRIDLMKIDTEGAEFEILSGAIETLSKVERIMMEWHSPLLLEQTSRLLEEHGFVEAHRQEIFGSDVGLIYFSRPPALPEDGRSELALAGSAA